VKLTRVRLSKVGSRYPPNEWGNLPDEWMLVDLAIDVGAGIIIGVCVQRRRSGRDIR
jgi:hypothetical protein